MITAGTWFQTQHATSGAAPETTELIRRHAEKPGATAIDPITAIWTEFAACLLLIGWAGAKLTVYGDAIADKTGLGGNWIGFILMATVTSIPELASGISAVTLAGVPDIAVGDILGSCIFNLTIIVILDFLHRRETVYQIASQGHILSAGFGIVLIGFAGFALALSQNGETFSLGHVGLYTPIILLMYLVAIRTVFSYESRQIEAFTEQEPDRYPNLSLTQVALRYFSAALVVVATGIWLPVVAREIAEVMHWRESFVGTLLVALITSVPEMVVAVAALRIGAVNMAIGDVFGSNLFNIMVLAVDDLFYTEGPLFAAVSPLHATSALSALMMTGIAIIGLFFRPRKRVLRTVGWASLTLFVIYMINTYIHFVFGRPG